MFLKNAFYFPFKKYSRFNKNEKMIFLRTYNLSKKIICEYNTIQETIRIDLIMCAIHDLFLFKEYNIINQLIPMLSETETNSIISSSTTSPQMFCIITTVIAQLSECQYTVNQDFFKNKMILLKKHKIPLNQIPKELKNNLFMSSYLSILKTQDSE